MIVYCDIVSDFFPLTALSRLQVIRQRKVRITSLLDARNVKYIKI